MNYNKLISLELFFLKELFKKNYNCVFGKKISCYEICFNAISLLARINKELIFISFYEEELFKNFQFLYREIEQICLDGYQKNFFLGDLELDLSEKVKIKVNDLSNELIEKIKFIETYSIKVSLEDLFVRFSVNDCILLKISMDNYGKVFNCILDSPTLYDTDGLLYQFQNVNFILKNWAYFKCSVIEDEKASDEYCELKDITIFESNINNKSLKLIGDNKMGNYCEYIFIDPEVECIINPSSFSVIEQ